VGREAPVDKTGTERSPLKVTTQYATIRRHIYRFVRNGASTGALPPRFWACLPSARGPPIGGSGIIRKTLFCGKDSCTYTMLFFHQEQNLPCNRHDGGQASAPVRARASLCHHDHLLLRARAGITRRLRPPASRASGPRNLRVISAQALSSIALWRTHRSKVFLGKRVSLAGFYEVFGLMRHIHI
jgi:hypothetical protein